MFYEPNECLLQPSVVQENKKAKFLNLALVIANCKEFYTVAQTINSPLIEGDFFTKLNQDLSKVAEFLIESIQTTFLNESKKLAQEINKCHSILLDKDPTLQDELEPLKSANAVYIRHKGKLFYLNRSNGNTPVEVKLENVSKFDAEIRPSGTLNHLTDEEVSRIQAMTGHQHHEVLSNVLANIIQPPTKLVNAVQREITKILDCNLFGIHLLEALYKTRKETFASSVENSLRVRGVKFPAELISNIELALTRYRIQHDIIDASFDITSISPSLINIATSLQPRNIPDCPKALTALHNSFASFAEVIKVGLTLHNFMLSREEIDYLASLCLIHAKKFTNFELLPKVINNIREIQPIYTLNLNDLTSFLDTKFYKATYIQSHFDKGGAALFKTLHVFSAAMNAYDPMRLVLNETEAELKKAKITRSTPSSLNLIKRYKECLESYFQQSIRFVMPIEAFYKAYIGILKANDSPALTKLLEGDQEKLRKCNELLKTTALILNESKTITEFIEKITTAIPKEKRYAEALVELKNYLNQITQSRTENYTNFQDVYKYIVSLCQKYEIPLVLTLGKKEQLSEAKQLLHTILNHYLNQVLKMDEITILETFKNLINQESNSLSFFNRQKSLLKNIFETLNKYTGPNETSIDHSMIIATINEVYKIYDVDVTALRKARDLDNTQTILVKVHTHYTNSAEQQKERLQDTNQSNSSKRT